jgi:hypothetical protein
MQKETTGILAQSRGFDNYFEIDVTVEIPSDASGILHAVRVGFESAQIPKRSFAVKPVRNCLFVHVPIYNESFVILQS